MKKILILLTIVFSTGCSTCFKYPPYEGYVNDGVMHSSSEKSMEYFMEPNLFFFKTLDWDK